MIKQRPELFTKTKYIITRETHKLTVTSFTIKDANSRPLGKLEIRELQNSGIRFFNNEGKQVGEITRHLSFSTRRSLENWNEETIGVVQQKLSTFLSPEFWVQDSQGEKILHIQGDFRNYPYSFFDMKGKKVAEVLNKEEGVVVRLTKEGKQQETDPFLILSAVFAVETTTKWGFFLKVLGALTFVLSLMFLPPLLSSLFF